MQTPSDEFPIEEIPDIDFLFYCIHKTKIDFDEQDEKKKIKPLAFDPQPKGSTHMSTDWSKYSTAIDAQNRRKVPADNGIVSFSVKDVRDIPLNVVHDPSITEHFKNRAHAIILEVPPRKNDIGIRLKLRDICSWAIPIA
jgi:hypothetical protein